MDREQIEARAKAATPGPWINNRNGVVTVESHPLAPTVSENSSWGDADFIAHARTDIDDLLTVIAITDKALDSAVEEIETLTARNAKLEAVAEDDVRDMANFCIAQGASKPWQEIARRLLAALDALDD